MANQGKATLLSRTAVLLTGHMSVVALQGLQFVLLARLLGADQFGRVAAVTALITIAAPFSGLGYGSIMLMHVSRIRNSASVYFANAVATAICMGLVLTGVLVFAASSIYDSEPQWLLVMLMASTELIAVRACVISGQLYQAIDRVRNTSLINTAVSACRLAGVSTLFFMDHPVAEAWAITVTCLMAVLALTVTTISIENAGGFQVDWPKVWKDKLTASHFAFGTAAKASYTDLDKVFLGIYQGSTVLGIYSSAYRLVVMAFMPIRALLDGVAARFFTEGVNGGKSTFAFAAKLLKVALPYGVLVGIALYFGAPYLPLVLGNSYKDAVPALQLLCLLPAIQAIHYVFSDALTGAGHQKLRTQLQMAALASYVVLGLILIPHYSWQGAAWTCIFSETGLAAMVVYAARLKAKTVATQQ